MTFPAVKPGISTATQIEIDGDRVIDFLGQQLSVYATPALLRDVEQTCQDLLLRLLPQGEHSVGTRVELEHLAATPLHEHVSIEARITAVDRRRVDFEFAIKDRAGLAARGTHQRFIVNLERLREQLQARRAL